MKFRQNIFVPHENTEKNFRTPPPLSFAFLQKTKISQILDKKVKTRKYL